MTTCSDYYWKRECTLHMPTLQWGPTLIYSSLEIDETLLKLTLINLKIDKVRLYN